MKRFFIKIMSLVLFVSVITPYSVSFTAAEESVADLKTSYSYTDAIDSDAWTAVDGLGRTLTSYDEAKDSKKRTVGIFYWTWHYSFANMKALNITDIINQYPEAKNNYYHKIWRKNRLVQNFWDEPLFGYYRSDDKYVLRKHAELLADAGVDVMIFDCTNAVDDNYAENRRRTWPDAYWALFETLEEAKEDGVNVPKVAFMLPFAPSDGSQEMLNILYEDIYSPGKYKDMWFYWKGKPLIMAHSASLSVHSDKDKEILNFFTFRTNDSSYFSSDRDNYWGWLSKYPQPKYGIIGNDGRPEQMAVGVAQNANLTSLTAMNGKNVLGRGVSVGDYSYSYTYKGEKITVSSKTENAYYYGINFQQQFDYAIECDPDFLFVTGWNEWIMGRFESWPPAASVGQGNVVENAFPDQFNAEYSRDIEPSAGVLKDYYYYQLVSNIRKYKGMDNVVPQMSAAAIDMNDLSTWDSVTSTYNHYTDSTYDRDADGFKGNHYENNTMRNDIVHTKFAYDNDNIYFYVETQDELTSHNDKAWMRLLIDIDASGVSPNWEGFEYIVNRVSPDGTQCTLETSKGVDEYGMWLWETVGKVNYKVTGKVLQIAIPRTMLGLIGDSIEFNFKWSDNMQKDGDILDFYSNGDVAPGGRFMFIAKSGEVANVPPVQNESDNNANNDANGDVSDDDIDDDSDDADDDSNDGVNNNQNDDSNGNSVINSDDITANPTNTDIKNDSADNAVEDIIIVVSVCVSAIGFVVIVFVITLNIRRKRNSAEKSDDFENT